MDELDVRIYKSLAMDPGNLISFTNVRKTNLAIAKELGVDEGTVRNRLDRMAKSGFIKERHVFANPEAMGKVDVHVRVEILPPSSKVDVIRKVKLVNGVYLVRDYFGNGLGIDLFCDDERSIQREVELISRVANADEVVTIASPPRIQSYYFTEADYKILEFIRKSPRKPFHLIARETRMSVKRVKTQLKRMLGAEVLLVANVLDYKVAKGIIKGDLVVAYDKSESKSKVDSELLSVLGNPVRVPFFDSSEYAVFSLMFRNISEQREMLGAVKRLRGVAKAYLDVVVDQHYAYELFDEMLAKQVEQVKALARRT